MRAQLTALSVLTACALGACGGDGEEPQSADEKQVRAVLKESLTTKDPKDCARLFTQAYLEQISAQRGEEARSSCREDINTDASAEVTVDSVEVKGATAIAEIKQKGAPGFKEATIGLRKADGRWRTGRYRDAKLDRDAFTAYFRRSLDDVSGANCALRDIEPLEDGQIVDALIGTDHRPLLIPLVVCALEEGLKEEGAPASVIACVSRRFRREVTSGAIGRKLDRANGSLDALTGAEGRDAGARIALGCVRAHSGEGGGSSGGGTTV